MNFKPSAINIYFSINVVQNVYVSQRNHVIKWRKSSQEEERKQINLTVGKYHR